MSEGKRQSEAFHSALERLPVAVVVVDGQRNLQPYNTRASELFEREGLRGDLLANRPSHPLSQLVTAILGGKPMGELAVTFPSGTRYRVAPSRQSPKGIGRWLMLLISADEPPSTGPSLDAFDFTPRERDVATLLLAGKTTDEICASLAISRDTFKTHTRRLLEKTATRSRAAFVAKVLRSR